jgi:hypothetical protein
LGITDFMLRYVAWLCLKDHDKLKDTDGHYYRYYNWFSNYFDSQNERFVYRKGLMTFDTKETEEGCIYKRILIDYTYKINRGLIENVQKREKYI